MLASKVTFFPQLRGTLANARAPRLDHAYRGASEMLAPISSTNTSRSAQISPATRARQAALRNSSRSLAPTDLFCGSTPYARASVTREQRSPLPRRHTRQNRSSGPVRRCVTLFEIDFQNLPRRFVELRFGAGTLLRSERLAF